MIYKPTKDDIERIKRAAARESVPHVGIGAVLLEPGIRYNTERDDIQQHMNILLVSNDPDWADTDLFDLGLWADFRKGVELTGRGDADVDFYIYGRGGLHGNHELLGNVTIEVRAGKLVRIFGYGNSSDYFNIKESI